MDYIFWGSTFCIWYAYLGYPLLIYILAKGRYGKYTDSEDAAYLPAVSMIIPAHNEEDVIGSKLDNTLELDYPADLLEVLVISDGSTDRTGEIVAGKLQPPLTFHELKERRGKAAALNCGLEKVKHDIIVFSDASILLEPESLQNIVRKFQNPTIGCVSGEDHIAGGGGEGLYGKYELFLRNQESKFHSIVGASGSFYAQRKHLCDFFLEGHAPDFLSVLNAVERGYRAITEPSARGSMSAVASTSGEFNRKVRTLIRGMTTLFGKPKLLNPFYYPSFAFEIWSHKIMRWLVPFFLTSMFLSNLFLLNDWVYQFLFIIQVLLYLAALFSAISFLGLHNSILGRIALYFVTVNAAIAVAWVKYLAGTRQEVWTPTNR